MLTCLTGYPSVLLLRRFRQSSTRSHISDIRRIVARWWASVQAELSETAEVDRVSENAGRFLRSVEAHRIFRHDEVDHELAFALVVASFGELCVCRSLCFLGFDVVDQVDQGVEGIVAQIEECVLNVFRSEERRVGK